MGQLLVVVGLAFMALGALLIMRKPNEINIDFRYDKVASEKFVREHIGRMPGDRVEWVYGKGLYIADAAHAKDMIVPSNW